MPFEAERVNMIKKAESEGQNDSSQGDQSPKTGEYDNTGSHTECS